MTFAKYKPNLNKIIPNPHRPSHIFADDTCYFVTGSTLHRAHLLAPIPYKTYLQEQLLSLVPEFGIDLKAWVILNNHYHLLFHLETGNTLSQFFQSLHGRTSLNFNRQDHQTGRQFWYNYWDWCIRDERDFWTHFNYVHYNPIKHGYVRQLRDWPFSSLFSYLDEKGQAWLDDCWRNFSIKEFEVGDDNF